MRRILGILLQLVGWGAAAYCALGGLAFCGIYLMGFIVTGGREGGGEFLVMLVLTAACVAVGYGLARLGAYLARPRAAQEQRSKG